MSKPKPLPLLMPPLAGQRWSCHSCGQCCRVLVGHLLPEDKQRLDKQNWQNVLAEPPYVRAAGKWVLNKRADGACVFLDDQDHCLIHAKFGEQAKPLACRIFPFSVRPVVDGWRVSFRFDCPSATGSKGIPADQHRPWLARLVERLPHPGGSVEDIAELQPGVSATIGEIDLIIRRYTQWLRNDERPLLQRLVGAARVTAILRVAKFETVRGDRFAEFVELLFRALRAEDAAASPPTARQTGLLRQLAFAHGEHVTLGAMQSGFIAMWARRWRQLRSARRFRVGKGQVPRIPGAEGLTTFARVESTRPAPDDSEPIESLILRYLLTRLESRSVFGAGYYGWRTFDGLTALWLSVAAIGWLARYAASSRQSAHAAFDDVSWAVGVVDRAATRLPILGATAERTRVLYLSGNDGVARLLTAYAPFETQS